MRMSATLMCWVLFSCSLLFAASLSAQNAAHQDLSDARNVIDRLSDELGVDIGSIRLATGTVDSLSTDGGTIVISSTRFRVSEEHLNDPSLLSTVRPVSVLRLSDVRVGSEVVFASDGTTPSSDHLPWLLVLAQP